jgi:hypothetical protein
MSEQIVWLVISLLTKLAGIAKKYYLGRNSRYEKDIPLEGRSDLLKILIAQPLTSNKYIKSDELANLEIDKTEYFSS